MRTVAIIQARMASTRLPGKVLADIGGRPMLAHVVARALACRALGQVVVATSDRPADDAIECACKQLGVGCFRGSEDDVLDRFHQAAIHFKADAIVRLTADCPLLDPAVIERVVRAFLDGRPDYASNTIECTYPDGLDTEVVGSSALERAWREATLASEREHVTPYIVKHPDKFRLANVRHSADLSALRWTVDESRDLEFVRAVIGAIGPGSHAMSDVLDALREHPELARLNGGIARNEGYERSVREERVVAKRGTP